MDDHITFRQLAEKAGVSMRQLGIKYGIPRRTYGNWASGTKPAPYIMTMMSRLIEIDYPKRQNDDESKPK